MQRGFAGASKLCSSAGEFVRLNHPDNAVLMGLDRDAWEEYHLEFVLGGDIAGQESKTAEGDLVMKAPWLQVLEVEYQIRKQAYYLVNKADDAQPVTIAEALQLARKDRDLIQKHFLTPLALTAGVEAARNAAASAHPRGPQPGGKTQDTEEPPLSAKQRRAAKAGAKAEARQKRATSPSPTPAVPWKKLGVTPVKNAHAKGKCLKYNRGSCTDKKCKWTHACSICGKQNCAATKHKQEQKP